MISKVVCGDSIKTGQMQSKKNQAHRWSSDIWRQLVRTRLGLGGLETSFFLLLPVKPAKKMMVQGERFFH